jgi:hypothetical protein
VLAWLLMQAVHELGHCVGAWLTGGRVVQVVLHPLAISRTDVSPNPAPRIELWAGPAGGVVLPLAAWALSRRCWKSASPWLRFFAGFCWIANGCYLGYGVIEPIGDADEELRRLGTPGWALGLFGLFTIPIGFFLWHGLGPEFGWGPQRKAISWKSVAVIVAVLMTVVLLEFLFSSCDRV